MSAKSAFPPEQLENIAAYLDGELPEEQAAEIERTLATNPQARQELQEMIAAWEMLDALPQIRATEEFTRQTMASIRMEASPAVPHPAVWKERALPVVAWAAILSCVAVLSYAVAAHWGRRSYQPILEDLALLENEPLYREVGSLEFLRAVREARLFEDQVDGANGSTFAVPWEPAAPSSAPEGSGPEAPIVLRYAWDEAVQRVERMTASQRDQILASYRRIQELPPERRQALERLHQAVANDPDLQVTLRRLVRWLRGLDPEQRDQIRLAADDEERLNHVRELRRTERLLALRFAPEELDRVLTLVEQRLPIPEDVRRRVGAEGQSEQLRRLRLLEMVARAMDFRGTPDAATWQELEKHIADESTRRLLLSEPDLKRRWWALVHAALMTAAGELARKHSAALADAAKLDELLAELAPDERNRILRMPADEARRELWRRYIMTKLQQQPKAQREVWPAVWQAYRLVQEIREVIRGEREHLRWFGGRGFDPRSRNGERPPFAPGRRFPGNRPRGPGAEDRPGFRRPAGNLAPGAPGTP